MKTISRYIMTLALLLTAATGAWAAEPNTVIWNKQTWKGWTASETTHTVGDITITCSGNAKAYENKNASGEPLAMVAGTTDAITFTSNGAPFTSIKIKMYGGTDPGLAGWTWDNGYYVEWSGTPSTSVTLSDCDFAADEITFTTEPPITVEWNASTKTGNFTQPASDVVLTPIYAKAAAFATTGTEPEVKTLLPAAAEGVIAGTDAPLIAEGTGIVAFAGTSTEDTQGTVMYAVTAATATEAPALDAANTWSADVPTAEDIADDGAEVKVWYYIQGADTPDGETATLDNTFNNSDVCTTPLTVTVLSNKFDLTLKAANANTIDATQASKGTVTVKVGTGAAVDKTGDITDEGKLTGIKMGSEVKLNAKQGYKFRKVEVKKKGAGPLAAAFEDGAKIKVGYQWNNGNTTYLEFTNSGGTYSLTSVSGNNDGNGFNSSTLTVKDSNVLALDVVCHPSGFPKMDDYSAQIEFDATSSTYKYSSKGGYFTGIISVSVNDTDVTDQLSELK